MALNKKPRKAKSPIKSNTAKLKLEDMPSYNSDKYPKDKRHEFTEAMGDFKELVVKGSAKQKAVFSKLEKMATEFAFAKESERRFIVNRKARSVNLAAARDSLFVDQFMLAAKQVKWNIPSDTSPSLVSRAVTQGHVLILSDLHIGSLMTSASEGIHFGELETKRRLSSLVRQVIDSVGDKGQNLDIMLLGDLIEGLLGHNDFDSQTFSEQCVNAVSYISQMIVLLSKEFNQVRVSCLTGNHERIKAVHEGRATSTKWNSYATMLYKFMEMQCKGLANTTFDIPKSHAVCIKRFNWNFFATHGDTHVRLGNPSAKAGVWQQAARNEQTRLRKPIHVFMAGHYHTPQVMQFEDTVCISNGMLVPPNGYAAGIGAADQNCGQYLFTYSKENPHVSSRYLRVGEKDDRNTVLDTLIR